MNRYAIIADDLTGATDAGAAFCLAGFRVEVALPLRSLASVEAEIVAITTNSRHDSRAVARSKVQRACAAVRKSGRELIYKKMDSTLQGNIVAEVLAARDACGFDTALVCPANPGQGRIVRDGELYVHGESYGALSVRFEALGLNDYESIGKPFSKAKLHGALGKGSSFVIADAHDEQDLQTLVLAARSWRGRILLAGSAGMAASLAATLRTDSPAEPSLSTSARPARCQAATMVRRKTLVLCGTRNPVTGNQLDLLVEQGGLDRFELGKSRVGDIGLTLDAGRGAVIHVPVHRAPEAVLLSQLRHLEPLLTEKRVDHLLLTGGDTALLVCRWLKIRSIALHGELLPGLAWGIARGGLADGLIVCTKPGGFGRTSSLCEAVEILSRRRVIGSPG